MKKLFLTSGLVLGVVCSGFAGDDITPGGMLSSDNTEAATCVYDVLDSYENAVSLEAKWLPKISGAITLDSKRYSSTSDNTGTAATTAATVTPLYSRYGEALYSSAANATAGGDTGKVTQLTTNAALTGYTFAGFYTGKAKTGTQVINGSGVVLDAATTQIATENATATWYAGYDPNISGTITLDSSIYESASATNAKYDTTPGGVTGTAPASLYSKYGVNLFDSSDDSVVTQLTTVPSRTGYTFNGIYTDKFSGGSLMINSSGVVQAAAKTQITTTDATATWYAHWTAKSYNITYAAGTCSGSGRTITNGLTYDSNYTVLGLGDASTASGVTQPTGYTFQGWTESLSGNAVRAAGYTYTPWQTDSTLTLTASCTANSDKTVTYSCGVVPAGATSATPGTAIGGTAPTAASNPTYDSSYSLATTAGSCAGLTGYHFGGWKCNYNMVDGSSYSGTTPNYSSSLVNNVWTVSASVSQYKVDANMTCTAIWVPNTYTVTYNCGVVPTGASTGTPGATVSGTAPTAASNPTYDSSYTLASTQGSCAGLNGYHFGGWKCNYDMSNGNSYSGTTPNYSSSLVNNSWTVSANVSNYKVNANMTCAAIWTPNTISLTFTAPEATSNWSGNSVGSCNYDGDITLPPAPQRTGYTFNGWTVSNQA